MKREHDASPRMTRQHADSRGLHLGSFALRIATLDERGPVPLVETIGKHLAACQMCRDEVQRLRGLLTTRLERGRKQPGPVLPGRAPEPASPVFDPRSLRPQGDRGDVFYEAQQEISRSFAELGQLENRARWLCREASTQLGFEIAALQLKDPRRGTIETVAAEGPAAKWVGASRHPMRSEERARWRDIQVDVALTGTGEVISGWDRRFDRDLYKRFGHRSAVRAFVPLALLRERQRLQYSAVAEWRPVEVASGNLAIRPVVPEGYILEVFGTIEAGYLNANGRRITLSTLKDLARLISFEGPGLYRSTLRSALESATEVVMRYSGAASATMHLLVDDLNRYTYNVVAGLAGAMLTTAETGGGGITDQPRVQGLGKRALAEGGPVWIPNRLKGDKPEELKDFNPVIWNKHGVRAMVAFPLRLRTQGGDLQGSLYVHYFRRRRIEAKRVQQAFRLVRRIVEGATMAIERQETNESRRQTSALLNLVLTRWLHGRRRHLLPLELVRFGRQIVGADVAAILGRAGNRWAARAAVVGSRQPTRAVQSFVHSIADSVLAEDVERQGLFLRDVREAPWLCGPISDGPTKGTFIDREGILSAAVLPLRSSRGRVLGFLFLGFRTARTFPESECAVIRLLAQLTEGNLRRRRPSLDGKDLVLARDYLTGPDPGWSVAVANVGPQGEWTVVPPAPQGQSVPRGHGSYLSGDELSALHRAKSRSETKSRRSIRALGAPNADVIRELRAAQKAIGSRIRETLDQTHEPRRDRVVIREPRSAPAGNSDASGRRSGRGQPDRPN